MTTTTKAPRDFGFGENEAMLKDIARRLLDERMPPEVLRQLVAEAPGPIYDDGQPVPWNRALWDEMVALGWSGLAVPAEDGGSELSMVGLVGLVEEIGRHAVASPLVSTLSSSIVLNFANGPAAARLRAAIAGGASATLAITDEKGTWSPDAVPLTVRRDGNELVIDGSASFVQDAAKANMFIVGAKLGASTMLCAVGADASGLEVVEDHIHDLTRDQATLRFNGVRIGVGDVVDDDGAAALRLAWPALLLLVAADLCGTSEWQLQTTVDYAKSRRQFEREIGFFQAVKHPLVDAMVSIDQARSLLYYAAAELDAGSDNGEQAARMAKSAACDAGAFISDRSVQLHGGIGFTWECDVHIFFKRSMHNQALFGDGVHHRKWLANTMIGPIE